MPARERRSGFELLKIVATLMIVSHHFVAKNAFNVDVDWAGIGVNKLFLQFIGNHAFIGNNLFFMCSAYFLVKRDVAQIDFRAQRRSIWRMERRMLCVSIGVFCAFWAFDRQAVSALLLVRSLFPLSTGMWWYPTTYAVFLLIQPFYHRGLLALSKSELQAMLAVMLGLWSVSTLVPVFDFGATNLTGFVMLYAIVFLHEKHGVRALSDRRLLRRAILAGYMLAALSIIALDLLGTRVEGVGQYACYLIRGNYRLLPMAISVAMFALASTWKIQNRAINRIAALTFGVYLIHMHPLMVSWLFAREGAVFDLSPVIGSLYLPLIAAAQILLCCAGCAGVEALRQCAAKGLARVFSCAFGKKARA